jgi:hypothetical protein
MLARYRCALGVAILFCASAASADPPVEEAGETPRRARVSLFAGWAACDSPDPGKLGFGLRAGTRLGATRALLSASVAQHLGTHEAYDYPAVAGSRVTPGHYEQTNRFGYASIDVGYQTDGRYVVFIPSFGVGEAWLLRRSCTPSMECRASAAPDVGLFLSPAVALYVPIGRAFFGVDARVFMSGLSIPTGDETRAVQGALVYGVAGMTL